MDGTTEPLLAVIGHPIAGNPAQFAFERALAALKLDWRVLSFEVSPANLGACLDGMEVLGFTGVLVDTKLGPLVARWLDQRGPAESNPPPVVDCLFRVERDSPRFSPADVAGEWLDRSIRKHFEARGRTITHVLRIGRRQPGIELSSLAAADCVRCKSTPEPEQIETADVLLIEPPSSRSDADATDEAPEIRLESEAWPRNDASKLVIDLTAHGHNEISAIGAKGYTTISLERRRAATLVGCLRRWTGREPAADVIQDAVEEYLSL